MFELLSLFPEIYGDLADVAMDPLLAALDQAMDDEQLLSLAWND